MSERTSIEGGFGYRRLGEQAADSSIVDTGDRDQLFTALSITRRF